MLPVALAAVFLIVQAQANHTRLFGFGLVALFFALTRLTKHFRVDTGHSGKFAVLFLLVAAGLIAGAYHSSPPGTTTDAKAPFLSVYDDDGSYRRWHPANLIAERDHVQVALMLSGWFGGPFDETASREARTLMKVTYDDLEYHHDELIDYGTQLTAAYDAWFDRTPPTHRYVYRSPKGRAKAAMPIFILLHGNGGNLKAPLWALKELADQTGTALIAPTGGRGQWTEDSTRAQLEATLQYCEGESDLDASKVLLIGIGNGGAAANYAARTMPERFAGFVHIASAFTPETTLGLADHRVASKKPYLVLHGKKDSLVPAETVEHAAQGLKRWNIPVSFEAFDDEGALLLFKRQDAIIGRVRAWMAQSASSA